MKQLCQAVVRQGRRLSPLEAEIVGRNGVRRIVSLELSPIRHGRKVAGAMAAARDVPRGHSFQPVVVGKGNVTEFARLGHDITERRHQEPLIRTGEEFSRLVQNLPDVISRLDSSLRFVYVSPNVVSLFGIEAGGFIGKRPHEIQVASHDWAPFENACRLVFTTGKAADREFVAGDRHYRARIVPEYGLTGKVESVLCIDQDITDQKRVESELRLMSTRLLDLQDAERRRIAREMHDGTAQNLFAISMALSRLLQQATDMDVRSTLGECLTLCEQSREEIRTLSYVLHPPILDEAGLVSALRWYVEGFARRTGIQVDFAVRGNAWGLPPQISSDLFRVAQEALANIHRHSGSASAAVRLVRSSRRILLRIRDWGCGMPPELTESIGSGALGVGILGMRERLRQLDGDLKIESSKEGTTVTAVVPLTQGKSTALTRGATRQRTAV
jgi:PAS domain S-box-containing protein